MEAQPLASRRCARARRADGDTPKSHGKTQIATAFSLLFGAIRGYSGFFGIIRDYSGLFGVIGRDSGLFGAIRGYLGLFGAIRGYPKSFALVSVAIFGANFAVARYRLARGIPTDSGVRSSTPSKDGRDQAQERCPKG